MKNGFLTELIKETGNEYAGLASDAEKFKDFGYIDTGSYALNALLSGSIYKGMVDNKILGFAGEEATGKTFFALAAVKKFLDDNPQSMACIFDTEFAIEPDMLKGRGIDPTRVAIMPVATIEEFRTQCSKMVDAYMKKYPDRDPKIMFVLDSLGNASTEKEVTDIEAGENKRDMTKQQLIRGTFRVLTLKLGKARAPFIVTNHIYMQTGMSFGDPRVMGGGGGLKYAASTILFLTKSQFKQDKGKGAVINCKLNKSRFTREGLAVKVLLHHETGLDRYYGLAAIAEEAGIITKVGNKYKFPDGSAAFEKTIIKSPEKYWTEEVLDMVDQYTQETWVYGGGSDEAVEEED